MQSGSRSRPTGITILAVLSFIAGVLGIFGGIVIVMGGGLLAGVGVSGGGMVFIYGIVLLVLSVVYLILGVGFWTLAPWAWQVGLILQGVAIVRSIGGLVLNYESAGTVGLSIVLSGGIIYYLLRPEIKAAFGQK